ncbi:YutD family protein [Caldalkalibacillus uzonensis]|uniref:YutD family protein n=1 Tax=Caldalkalibacillus uzonensis TaxID=353224 RepID=UPI0027D79AE7|nr:YutD family protein [Caldalkalibacillus uzonensis]
MADIVIKGQAYEVVKDVRQGWNPEAFRQRYSEVLTKYDYIVGDWGYSQLRLRGFYDDHNKKVKPAFDAKISTLDEYIYEYCNFGCAYFVLKKIKKREA